MDYEWKKLGNIIDMESGPYVWGVLNDISEAVSAIEMRAQVARPLLPAQPPADVVHELDPGE